LISEGIITESYNFHLFLKSFFKKVLLWAGAELPLALGLPPSPKTKNPQKKIN
jgi:hypothetical protein